MPSAPAPAADRRSAADRAPDASAFAAADAGSSRGLAVELVSRAALAHCPRWQEAFRHERKDHRYYEIVEDTLPDGFDYRYFVIRDDGGAVRAVQPCFILDQDLLQGTGARARALAGMVRRWWPRFLRLRALMVGCSAGEGHVDADDPAAAGALMQALASSITAHARAERAPLIVLKELPARYRPALAAFVRAGFTPIPSLPMTTVDIGYPSFEDYLNSLSSKTRKDLRKKLRIAARAAPIEMSVVVDISAEIDDVYPLYLAVYERSELRFEKLSREYFCRLGREMPDKVRFFIWRQNGRAVAFSLCMLQDDAIYAEYLGLDYEVALELHLYHYVLRDVVSWAIANGCRSFRSSGGNYDPKLHLKARLDPLDLYVRHTSPALNSMLRLVLPFLEPTRNDKTLRKFPNYDALAYRDPSG